MAVLTLNQVISRIRSLALSHHQVKHFYFGSPEEFDAREDITYPACFLEFNSGVTDRSIHQTVYSFRLYLLDLVKVATDTEGNETEVLSDMSSVWQDILAMTMFSDYEDTWIVKDTANFVPVTEALNDMDAGVIGDLNIAIDFLADRCQVPADDVTFETDFDMSRTKLVTYDATGSEGNSWTIPVIAGKIVIAAYRSSAYRRPITTTPDGEEIQLAGMVLTDNKGIAATGVVTLQAGDQPILDEKFDFLIHD